MAAGVVVPPPVSMDVVSSAAGLPLIVDESAAAIVAPVLEARGYRLVPAEETPESYVYIEYKWGILRLRIVKRRNPVTILVPVAQGLKIVDELAARPRAYAVAAATTGCGCGRVRRRHPRALSASQPGATR